MKLNHHPSPYNLVAHNSCWGVATSRHLKRDPPSQSPKDNAISPPLIDYLLSSPSIRTTINFLFIASRNALSLIVVLARAQDTLAGVWPSRVQNHQHKNHLFFPHPFSRWLWQTGRKWESWSIISNEWMSLNRARERISHPKKLAFPRK